MDLNKDMKEARDGVMQVSKERAFGLEKTASAKALRQDCACASEEPRGGEHFAQRGHQGWRSQRNKNLKLLLRLSSE